MSHSGSQPDAKDIHEFLQEVASRPRIRNLHSPGVYPSTLEFKEDESSQHESDGVSRVADYGFQAWAQSSQKSKPSHDSGDLIGLESPDVKSPITPPGNLAMSLESAMLPAKPNDAQTYLPLGQIESICPRGVVHHELQRTFGEDCPEIDQYTDYVCGNQDDPKREENISRKIFANLVLIGQLHRIRDFMEAGIRDRHLPFRKSSREHLGETFTLVKRVTFNRTKSETVFCFNDWNPVEKRKFYDNQWRLLSPYFDRASDGTVGLYELDEQCIMPWVDIGEEKRGTFVPLENIGGYAKVTKFSIHPDHHAFDCKNFAIKQLFEDDDTPFHQEFKNLKKVQTKDHLLPVYAAYRRGKQYSFIFPWADGGSLIDLWSRDPRELKERVVVDTHEFADTHRAQKVISWVACQFSGLTGRLGLGFLHDNKFLEQLQPTLVVPDEMEKQFGIHGDIKPHNILYFEQDHNGEESNLGLFKISDFGLTGFHSALTRSRHQPPGPHSPTYRAPEYRDFSAYLSRKYDIWSLGCVMLQFLTWLISGPDGLRQFDEARLVEMDQNGLNFVDDKFFVITHNGDAGHKHSVQSHVEKLQSSVTKGSYLYDCLALIRDRMLHLDVSTRADCQEVHKRLATYHKRCLQDTNYVGDVLPTFQARASPLHSHPSAPVPHIVVTSHSLNAQPIASGNVAHPNHMSDAHTTPAGNRVITHGNAYTTKNKPSIDHADPTAPSQDRLSRQFNNTMTEEKQKTNKVRKVLSYLTPRRLVTWHERQRTPTGAFYTQ
ncbi:kinase-like domain-containing protein [Xylaria arbuscula]|nr:kinase-like domain-containing protein [Xylaria arbuscula]